MKRINGTLKYLLIVLLFTSFITFKVSAQDDIDIQNEQETIETIQEEDNTSNKDELELTPIDEEIIGQEIYDINVIDSNQGKAYAVLQSNGNLIFFRSNNTYTNEQTGSFIDIYSNPYTGTIFTGIEDLVDYGLPGWQSDLYIPKIKNVYVAENQTIVPKTMYNWFNYCSNLVSFNSAYFDTSNVTNMSGLFAAGALSQNGETYVSSLTNLDLSNLDTSNVTNMSSMFYGCSSLTELDLSNFNTSNAVDMYEMFGYCSSLKSLNLRSFNTSNATSMSTMFYGCSSLETLDISSFNTSKVTDMSWMFSDCMSLKDLDLSNFDTSKVTDMNLMFDDCSSLKSLDLSSFNTSNVTDMNGMFYGCISLSELDLSSFNTSKVTNMGNMFEDCRLLSKLNLSNFNTSKVTDMSYMFATGFYNEEEQRFISHLTTLDISHFNTSNVEDMSGMFYGCSALKSLNLSNFNTAKVIDMNSMFENCKSLTSLDLKNFNTSKVMDMEEMFRYCESLKTLNLSSFNTSNVENMKLMFNYCISLKSLNLSNFNTKKVIDMCGMFDECKSLTSLNLSSFNTLNVSDMSRMFNNCESLTKMNLSNFNTSNVVDMNMMFGNCKKLTSLNINNFDVAQVYDMSSMFGFNVLDTIVLSSKFNKWDKETGVLPKGTWVNKAKKLMKTETKLYMEYPKNASKYSGTWTLIKDLVPCKLNETIGWESKNSKQYWYENGIKQGIYGSNGNVFYDNIERGREIYDPCSNGWYWLDAVYDGAKAVNKEVFMPYVYSDEDGFSEERLQQVVKGSNEYTEDPQGTVANMGEQVKRAIEQKTGKWVRYNSEGKMIKGWYTVEGADALIYPNQVGNTYWYDYMTGLMAKGETIIGGRTYYFDEVTGVLQGNR